MGPAHDLPLSHVGISGSTSERGVIQVGIGVC